MVKESNVNSNINNNSAYKANTSTIQKFQKQLVQPKVINCMRDSSRNPEEYLKDCCIGKIIIDGSNRQIKCNTAKHHTHLNNYNKQKYTHYYNEFLDKMYDDRVYAKQQMGDYFTKPTAEQQRLLEQDRDYFERVDGGKRKNKRKTKRNTRRKKRSNRKTKKFYY
jgi:hypothetical protein